MKSFTLIHGYLGREPEIKRDAYIDKNGKSQPLVNFSVGVGRDFGDETDWYDVTMFGPRAEVIYKFFGTGSQIIVQGRMQSTTVNKDGVKRKYWKLIADDFDFCDSKDSPRGQNNIANAFPEPTKSVATVDDIPDSWEQAEEDNPF